MRGRRRLLKVLPEPFTVSESVTVALASSADDVFAFMWDPASTRVLNPRSEHCFTVPGTPSRAVGEVQVHVSRVDGVLEGSLIEVQSLVEGRRAVTRTISGGLVSHQVLDVAHVDERSCLLTQEFRSVIPVGSSLDYVAVYRGLFRADLDALGARLVEHFGAPRADGAGS